MKILIYYEHISDLKLQDIPNRIGTYVITHIINDTISEKYVGSTRNLKNRIYNHYNKNILNIDLYITNDILTSQSLERILIELIKPATNIKRLSLLKIDDKLLKELLENDEIKKHINNNTKIGCRYLKNIIKSKRTSCGCAVPLYEEEFDLLKQRQLNIMNRTNKKVTMTEVASDVIREGLKVLELKELKEGI